MFVIDYILFSLFTIVGWCLVIGLSSKEKKWIGGIGGLLNIIFIVGSQIAKFQSGYFGEYNQEAAEAVGQWVLTCFVVLGIYLLGMINYRWIKAALKRQSWLRGGLIGLDILFSLVYIWAGGFLIFMIAIIYFPFAP